MKDILYFIVGAIFSSIIFAIIYVVWYFSTFEGVLMTIGAIWGSAIGFLVIALFIGTCHSVGKDFLRK